jgi:hypothetical protein
MRGDAGLTAVGDFTRKLEANSSSIAALDTAVYNKQNKEPFK